MAEKKYRKYTYNYTRFNPQTGSHVYESTVIAFSKPNAERLAKAACSRAIYGHNTFMEITGIGPVLTEGVDYQLVERYNSNPGYHDKTWEKVAEEMYHR